MSKLKHRASCAAVAAALLAPLGAAFLPAPAAAQEAAAEDPVAAYVRSHYAKREVLVPMRDGVRLFTSIYTPNDAGVGGKIYPILMNRTPYDVGPYGAAEYKDHLGPSAPYAGEGFAFVYQDVRGKYMSEGEFVNMRPEAEPGPGGVDEATDTYDTIAWLLENVPGNNGKVGLWGISYPGFYASAGAIHSHPALKAVSPQAPIADWFWDDFHRHGAFILPMAFNFFASFGQPRPEPTTESADHFDHGTPDGYAFFLDLGPLSNVNARYLHGEVPFWNDIAAHPNYDAYWQERNILPNLRGVGAAVMVVGGWFDTEDLYGPLATYRAIERQNPGAFNVLVMGPWPHGGWSRGDGRSLGGADFGFETSDYYREHFELPFFRHFLKGGEDPYLAEANVFETGADRWRRFPAWPPPGLAQKTLYLQEGGELSFEAPQATEATEVGEAADRFVS
ncbi:MAG TPA: CocE/NonD family hydrolase, partial [Thermoanaerobaculia bacterium]|nr:CocE/NonD family hydrolase [Thermoanaerobaculia bacterium]